MLHILAYCVLIIHILKQLVYHNNVINKSCRKFWDKMLQIWHNLVHFGISGKTAPHKSCISSALGRICNAALIIIKTRQRWRESIKSFYSPEGITFQAFFQLTMFNCCLIKQVNLVLYSQWKAPRIWYLYCISLVARFSPRNWESFWKLFWDIYNTGTIHSGKKFSLIKSRNGQFGTTLNRHSSVVQTLTKFSDDHNLHKIICLPECL